MEKELKEDQQIEALVSFTTEISFKNISEGILFECFDNKDENINKLLTTIKEVSLLGKKTSNLLGRKINNKEIELEIELEENLLNFLNEIKKTVTEESSYLKKEKCSNCKFRKKVFSYNLPLCIIDETEPFQITNENRTQCPDWEKQLKDI